MGEGERGFPEDELSLIPSGILHSLLKKAGRSQSAKADSGVRRLAATGM